MSSTITINIKNETKVEKTFYIFASLPSISPKMENVYTQYFLKDTVPPTNNTTFSFDNLIYACAAKQEIGPGVVITGASENKLVSLKQKDSVQIQTFTAKVDRNAQGDTVKTIRLSDGEKVDGKSYADGTFLIKTTDNSKQGDNTYIGIAKKTPAGDILPVAIFAPSPKATYVIRPVIKFYIAWGDYTPGVLMDVQAIGDSVQEIDFTGQPWNAKLSYLPNGTYSAPTFS